MRDHPRDSTTIHIRADGFSLDPEEILSLLEDPSACTVFATTVTQIHDKYVVKRCRRLVEAMNSELARQNTTIPIPKVLLAFCIDGSLYIVFEAIRGVPLHHVWPRSNKEEREAMTLTVASYVRQLRQIEPLDSRPGHVDPKFPWHGTFFSLDQIYPFESHEELVNWLNRCAATTKRLMPEYKLPTFTTQNYRLTFTHGDISVHNFVVDGNNLLWMIDWDTAGWFPEYMEYACIKWEVVNPVLPKDQMIEWTEMLTSAIDPYDEESHMMHSLLWITTTRPFML